jgi:hypothetical protein
VEGKFGAHIQASDSQNTFKPFKEVVAMFSWFTKIKERIQMSLIAKYIGSIVRHAIQALVGVIGTLGIIDPAILDQWVDPTVAIVVAVALYLLNQLWSFKVK